MTTWGITIRFGLTGTPPADALDALLDSLVLSADSKDPTLRAAVEVGDERVEVGAVAELVEWVVGKRQER